MTAHVWRSWVKALDVKPQDYLLRLTFSVNVRTKLSNPPLKDGFYGNAVCVACVTISRDLTKYVVRSKVRYLGGSAGSAIDLLMWIGLKCLNLGGKLTGTFDGLGFPFMRRPFGGEADENFFKDI
ncbi:hypothetical protein Leryth_010929 [Lithospermum erythrorhizon]|nr:hypothetical protein Leryth_010929 [Lithospermum erythrorhizon]